jgi:hypothetical protein
MGQVEFVTVWAKNGLKWQEMVEIYIFYHKSCMFDRKLLKLCLNGKLSVLITTEANTKMIF